MTLVAVDDKATNSAGSGLLTLRDIIYKAMYRLNLYNIRNTPPDNEVGQCVSEFNAMMQGWYFSDRTAGFTVFGLNDNPNLSIGTSDPLYYDDCLIDNLATRLIELYNLDPKMFGQIYMRAKKSLNVVTNLKREKENDGNTFQSDFDATLRNTPDIASHFTVIK